MKRRFGVSCARFLVRLDAFQRGLGGSDLKPVHERLTAKYAWDFIFFKRTLLGALPLSVVFFLALIAARSITSFYFGFQNPLFNLIFIFVGSFWIVSEVRQKHLFGWFSRLAKSGFILFLMIILMPGSFQYISNRDWVITTNSPHAYLRDMLACCDSELRLELINGDLHFTLQLDNDFRGFKKVVVRSLDGRRKFNANWNVMDSHNYLTSGGWRGWEKISLCHERQSCWGFMLGEGDFTVRGVDRWDKEIKVIRYWSTLSGADNFFGFGTPFLERVSLGLKDKK